MQRITVDLPEPDGPQITTRSPLRTVSETSFRAWNWPYHLFTLRNSIITGRSLLSASMARPPGRSAGLAQLPLQQPGAEGERVAQREIDQGDDAVYQHGLEGRVADDLAGLGQF